MTSPHFTTSPHFGDVPTFWVPEKKKWGRRPTTYDVLTFCNPGDVPTFSRFENVGMSPGFGAELPAKDLPPSAPPSPTTPDAPSVHVTCSPEIKYF